MVTLFDIIQARQRLAPFIPLTPIESAPSLGQDVYLKLENANIMHAFKIRGAMNAILAKLHLIEASGVVTSSAGNHAMGLVYAAHQIGVPATVIMPEHAPQRKIKGVWQYGAEVILHGEIYDESEVYARQYAFETGKLFVSPYNDADVIAGQGTIALEILEQLPTVGQVIVPVGGGGLISGIGVAMRNIKPSVHIFGVQSYATPAMYNLLYDDDLPQDTNTLADGLSGDIEAGSITVPLCRETCEQVFLVPENAIADAVRWMFETQGWVIEGSAAVGIAALRDGAFDLTDGPTVLVITGGNIDSHKFLELFKAE